MVVSMALYHIIIPLCYAMVVHMSTMLVYVLQTNMSKAAKGHNIYIYIYPSGTIFAVLIWGDTIQVAINNRDKLVSN